MIKEFNAAADVAGKCLVPLLGGVDVPDRGCPLFPSVGWNASLSPAVAA